MVHHIETPCKPVWALAQAQSRRLRLRQERWTWMTLTMNDSEFERHGLRALPFAARIYCYQRRI